MDGCTKLSHKIILASASQRRRELLSQMGYKFEIVVQPCAEVFDEHLPIGRAIEEVAYQKCQGVANAHPDAIVIGADTIVFIDGRRLGKPRDEMEAYLTLKTLSGRAHQVYSGVALIYQKQVTLFHECSDVYFRKLSDEEIREYIATDEPYDKAGAYGIQGQGGKFVDHIEGEYDNIVGLPCKKLGKILKGIMNQ